MKLIARILAMLAAALVVVGITFAISQTSFAQSAMPSMPDRAALVQSSTTQSSSGTSSTLAASATPQHGPDGDHGGQGLSLFGAIALLQNVVVVGAIVALVSFAKWLWARIGGKSDKGKRKRMPAAPSAT